MRQHVIVTGPTCSGKGRVALELAHLRGAEIVSLDSMKVYRVLDIGTAKPDRETREGMACHLIDVVDPSEEYSLGRYMREALAVVADIERRGMTAVIVGGTPLYLRALVRGFCPAPGADAELRAALEDAIAARGLSALHEELRVVDPEAAARIHPHDRRRMIRALEVRAHAGKPLTALWRDSTLKLAEGTYRLYGLSWPRDVLYGRIEARVDRMVAAGLFSEAREAAARYPVLSRSVRQCIGYREIWEGDARGRPREEIIAAIKLHTRRFARKQLTWFRHFTEIEWLDVQGQPPDRLACAMARGMDADSARPGA